MSADASYSLGVISNCNYIGGVKPRLIVPIDQHVHTVHLVTQQILYYCIIYVDMEYVDVVLHTVQISQIFRQLLGLGCINFENLSAHQQEEILRIPKYPTVRMTSSQVMAI